MPVQCSLGKTCGAVLGILVLAMPKAAHAILVGPGDGTQDTTQGSMPNGWNYVGTVDSASGTYLGNGWVITADHIGGIVTGSSFTIDGYGTYLCNGNVVRLTDPNTSQDVDLQMFQLATAPALAPLNIASSTPAAGTSIYMVGYGHSQRNVQPTYYAVTGDPNNPTWTVVANPSDANAGGFGYDPSAQIKRWGTNLTAIDPVTGQTTSTQNIGNGATTCLYADFYDSLADYLASGGTSEEGMATAGDSGGGIFESDNTLVALNAYVDTYINQPANTAMFGDGMDPIDLAAYQPEITSIMVPEPSGGLLMAAAVFSLLAMRRRKMNCL